MCLYSDEFRTYTLSGRLCCATIKSFQFFPFMLFVIDMIQSVFTTFQTEAGEILKVLVLEKIRTYPPLFPQIAMANF